MLSLEGAQAGLSWDTILRKREAPKVVSAVDRDGLLRPNAPSENTNLSPVFSHFLVALVEFRMDMGNC